MPLDAREHDPIKPAPEPVLTVRSRMVERTDPGGMTYNLPAAAGRLADLGLPWRWSYADDGRPVVERRDRKPIPAAIVTAEAERG